MKCPGCDDYLVLTSDLRAILTPAGVMVVHFFCPQCQCDCLADCGELRVARHVKLGATRLAATLVDAAKLRGWVKEWMAEEMR